jgi:hypothetical protein
MEAKCRPCDDDFGHRNIVHTFPICFVLLILIRLIGMSGLVARLSIPALYKPATSCMAMHTPIRHHSARTPLEECKMGVNKDRKGVSASACGNVHRPVMCGGGVHT